MAMEEYEYQCPKCKSPVSYGDLRCKACSTDLDWGAVEDTKTVHKTLGTQGEIAWIVKGYGWWKVLSVFFPLVGIIVGTIGLKSYDQRTLHRAKLLRRLGIVTLAIWVFIIIYMTISFVAGWSKLG